MYHGMFKNSPTVGYIVCKFSQLLKFLIVTPFFFYKPLSCSLLITSDRLTLMQFSDVKNLPSMRGKVGRSEGDVGAENAMLPKVTAMNKTGHRHLHT
jgi:hypothetical protein